MDAKRPAEVTILHENAAWLFDIAERLRATPELGFFEEKTAEILAAELSAAGARVQGGLARTGIRAELGPPGAPAVFLVADMDALPTLGAPGGVAHSCGHHAQMAVMLAVFRAFAQTGTPEREGVRVVFLGTPAEEYVDLPRRMTLRDEGKIVYLSGKQEMIRLGLLDDAAVALKYHSMGDSPDRKATVNGIMNGFMAKRAEFSGRAAHAGAHPDKGVNALNAANLALLAIHAQRETFKDDDHIRVHPILTEGGTAVNSVPARAVLETYVRGASHEAVRDASAKVDRALRAGAMAVGARVRISDRPGYRAFRPSAEMGEVLGAAARARLPEKDIDFADSSYASDDIGDIAELVPTCQLGYSGFFGTIHDADFAPVEPGRAYLEPAEILLRAALDLAESGGRKALAIRSRFIPRQSREEYLVSLDSMFGSREYDDSAP